MTSTAPTRYRTPNQHTDDTERATMTAKTSTETKPAGETKVRHMRIPNDIWDGAGQTAEDDGYTLSQVTRQLLDSYRRGDIKLTAKRVRKG